MTGPKPRDIALRVLSDRAGGEFVEKLLETSLAAAADISAADRHLCQELVYGIVRWEATLDWLIARKTNGRPQKQVLRNILRLGLYQIFWLDRIPNHAAVHETVELAKHAGFGLQAGFVNALLRGCLRESDAIRTLLEQLKQQQPHLGYSHPEWLVTRWSERWGPQNTAKLLQWNNASPSTFARVNTLKVEPGKLLELWRNEGVDYDFVQRDWLEPDIAFLLKSHPPFQKLPSFNQGFFYIQDPSTLLAVRELDPRPGDSILDFCAAPGGKLSYIAQLMRNEGRVVAHDTSSDRLQLVSQNCTRLGLTCVAVIGPGIPDLHRASFDRVLVDAPCSNTGVVRRRIDLRWRIRPEEISRLQTVQTDLLRQAAAMVKPSGVLVYSTCSLEPDENHQVIVRFLQENPLFVLERDRELLPFVDNVDGAYVVRLKRMG